MGVKVAYKVNLTSSKLQKKFKFNLQFAFKFLNLHILRAKFG